MPATPRDVGPPAPNGFGQCRGCPYVTTGPIATCHACASERFDPPAEVSCPICHLELSLAETRCWNRLCNSPDRAFENTAVIGVKAGILEQTIWSLKDGNRGWGLIHARIVLGYLYCHPEVLDGIDAIVPTPGLPVIRDGRTYQDHTAWVIHQAKEQDDRGLPFVVDPSLIIKVRQTTRMRDTSSAWERSALGGQLLQALHVPSPDAVAGRTIMVFDDVFTSGNTLNAVAKRLKAAGAAKVYGLTLARQPRR